MQDTLFGASAWSRDSEFVITLAEGLGLPSGQVDVLFRSAGTILSKRESIT